MPRSIVALSVLLLACAPGCITTVTYGELSWPRAYAREVALVELAGPDARGWTADVEVTLSDGTRRRDRVALSGWPSAATIAEPGTLRTRVVPAKVLGRCGGVLGLSRLFPPRLMRREGGAAFAVEVQDGERWVEAASFAVRHEPPTVCSRAAFFALLPLTVALDVLLLPVEAAVGLGLFR